MALKGVSTPAVLSAGVGALVIWSAVKGSSATGGLRSLLTGKQPGGQEIYPLGSSETAQEGSAGTATGNAIADAALAYQGSGSVYQWGGGSPKGWDCSGFVNWVIGHDLGLPIPGHRNGRYTGHGPVTWQWATFGSGIGRKRVQAGDLVVWPAFHMGIAISNTQMINAPGPNGTPAPIISNIDGGGAGVLVCRRVATGVSYTGVTGGKKPL